MRRRRRPFRDGTVEGEGAVRCRRGDARQAIQVIVDGPLATVKPDGPGKESRSDFVFRNIVCFGLRERLICCGCLLGGRLFSSPSNLGAEILFQSF